MSDLLAKSMRLAPYALAVFGLSSMLVNAATSIMAMPGGPGYSAQPEPVPVSALAGEYPYRGEVR